MTRWYQEKKKEHFYKKAKKEGYRARSAYKLKDIQKKFSLIKKNDFVLDLGCAPGGWSQITREIIGNNGKIIGVDISSVKSMRGVFFIKGDMTEDDTVKEIEQVLGNKNVDVVLTDMSPDISGNYDMDQARSIYLCKKAFETAQVFLKSNGNFVCKAFEGKDMDEFFKVLKNKFRDVKRFSPKSSRKSSSEIYIIGKGFEK